MCHFLSALVLRNGDVLSHPMLDSHADLVTYFKLPDTSAYINHFAKVELRPVDWADASTWTWTVDEPTLPTWWDDVAIGAEATLRARAAAMILKDGEHVLIVDGCWIVAGTAKIRDVRSGRIVRVQDSAQVSDVGGSAQVRDVWDSAQVTNVGGSAQVRDVWDSAQVTNVWDSAQVTNVGGSAQVTNVGDSAQVSDVGGSAQVSDVWGSAQVTNVGDSAQVSDVGGSAQVTNVWGSAQVTNVGGSAQVRDVWDSAQVTNVGDSAQVRDVWGSVILDESARAHLVMTKKGASL